VGAAIPSARRSPEAGEATIRFTTQTDDARLSFSWQWSAAVYNYWPSDWNQALVQPYHGNGLHADTPTNTQVQIAHPGSARWGRFELHRVVERDRPRRLSLIDYLFDGLSKAMSRRATR
jgi:hypothetical protein